MDPCNIISTGPKNQLTTELDKLQNDLEVEQHVPQSQETEIVSNSLSNQLLCHEIPPTDKSPINLVQCPPQLPINLVQCPPQLPINLVQYPPQPPINLVQCPPQLPINLLQYPPQPPINLVQCPPQLIDNSSINQDQYHYQAQPPQAGDPFNKCSKTLQLPTQNSNPSQQTNYNSPNCIEYLDLPTWNPNSARTNDSPNVSPTVFPGSSLASPCVSCGHCSMGSVPPTQPQWSSNQNQANYFPQCNPNAPRHSMPAPSIPRVVVNQHHGSQTKEYTGVETRRPSININITVSGKCKHDKGTTEKFSKCGICCCLLIPVIGCIFCMKRKDLVCIKCDKVVGKATSKKTSENNQEKSGERKGDVKTKKGKEHDNSKKELGKAKHVKGTEKKKSDANGEKSGIRKVVQTSTKAKEHGKSKKKIDKKKLLKDN